MQKIDLLKYDKNAFHAVLKFSKYSDKTAPYKKCLELVTPTDVSVTIADAPPDNN